MSLRGDLNKFWENSSVRWIVGLSISAFVAYAFWSEYHRTIVNFALGVLIVAAGFLGEMTMDWKLGAMLVLLLWIIREIRLLKSLLSAVHDLFYPTSQHFQRTESEARKARIDAGLAEYEQERWRIFQGQAEKQRGGSE